MGENASGVGTRITRRRLSRLALAGAAAVGLAGCGGARQPAGGGQAAAAKPAGKLYIMSRADPSILDLFKEQVKAFQAENPTVQVDIDHQSQDAWLEKFKSMVASGAALDSAFANDSNAVPFARDGLTENLEPYLARQKDFKEADFATGSWFAMRYQNKRYGLPWDSGAYAVYYNMDLFDAAGVPYPDAKKRMSWDDLLTVARRLTIDANGRRPNEGGFDPARVQQYGFSSNTTWGIAHFVHSNGGEMLTADGKVPLDQPPAIDAIQFMADLRSKHFVWNAPQFTTAQPIGFRNNNLAMDHNGAWQIGRFATDVKRVGVAPAPAKKNPTSGGHYSPLVMTKHSQNKDTAWAWMYFACLSEKGQTILSDAGQMQPTRKSLVQRFLNAPGGKVEAKYRQVFVDELENKDFRVAGDKMGTYWGGYPGWGPTLTPLLTPVWRGEKSMAQVAGELRRLTEQYLQTGQAPVINS
jgi:multiple sugar transport system substrate-binding protein